jgi:hypothetical protein
MIDTSIPQELFYINAYKSIVKKRGFFTLRVTGREGTIDFKARQEGNVSAGKNQEPGL